MKNDQKNIENLARKRYLCKGTKPLKSIKSHEHNNNTIKNYSKYINLKFLHIIILIFFYFNKN